MAPATTPPIGSRLRSQKISKSRKASDYELTSILTAKSYHSDDSREEVLLTSRSRYEVDRDGLEKERYRNRVDFGDSWDDNSSVLAPWRSIDEDDPIHRSASYEVRDWFPDETSVDSVERDLPDAYGRSDVVHMNARDDWTIDTDNQNIARMPSLFDEFSDEGTEPQRDLQRNQRKTASEPSKRETKNRKQRSATSRNQNQSGELSLSAQQNILCGAGSSKPSSRRNSSATSHVQDNGPSQATTEAASKEIPTRSTRVKEMKRKSLKKTLSFRKKDKGAEAIEQAAAIARSKAIVAATNAAVAKSKSNKQERNVSDDLMKYQEMVAEAPSKKLEGVSPTRLTKKKTSNGASAQQPRNRGGKTNTPEAGEWTTEQSLPKNVEARSLISTPPTPTKKSLDGASPATPIINQSKTDIVEMSTKKVDQPLPINTDTEAGLVMKSFPLSTEMAPNGVRVPSQRSNQSKAAYRETGTEADRSNVPEKNTPDAKTAERSRKGKKFFGWLHKKGKAKKGKFTEEARKSDIDKSAEQNTSKVVLQSASVSPIADEPEPKTQTAATESTAASIEQTISGGDQSQSLFDTIQGWCGDAAIPKLPSANKLQLAMQGGQTSEGDVKEDTTEGTGHALILTPSSQMDHESLSVPATVAKSITENSGVSDHPKLTFCETLQGWCSYNGTPMLSSTDMVPMPSNGDQEPVADVDEEGSTEHSDDNVANSEAKGAPASEMSIEEKLSVSDHPKPTLFETLQGFCSYNGAPMLFSTDTVPVPSDFNQQPMADVEERGSTKHSDDSVANTEAEGAPAPEISKENCCLFEHKPSLFEMHQKWKCDEAVPKQSSEDTVQVANKASDYASENDGKKDTANGPEDVIVSTNETKESPEPESKEKSVNVPEESQVLKESVGMSCNPCGALVSFVQENIYVEAVTNAPSVAHGLALENLDVDQLAALLKKKRKKATIPVAAVVEKDDVSVDSSVSLTAALEPQDENKPQDEKSETVDVVRPPGKKSFFGKLRRVSSQRKANSKQT